jgi:hypothetical protein
MSDHQDPFYVQTLARLLARKAGRASVNTDEARAIVDALTEHYVAGAFTDDEVAVFTGEPGEPPTLHTLAELKAAARRRGDEWNLSPVEFAVAGHLTAAAVRRCLLRCSLDSAARLLREQFGEAEAAASEANHAKTPLSRKRRRGPQATMHNRLTDHMFNDLRAGRRTVAELEADTFEALSAEYGGCLNTQTPREEPHWRDFRSFRLKL